MTRRARRLLPALLLAAAAIACCSRQTDRGAPSSKAAGGTDAASADSVPRSPDWQIEPGRRVGPLELNGTQASLAAVYGTSEVRAERVELGEGETAPGTLLFPEQPDRRIQIIWSDSTAMGLPARVILRGERSRWMLPGHVSLGTSLKELESKNGRAFKLAGFGWDYAGVVTSWEGGALDASLAPGVKLYLEPRIEDRSGPEYRKVLGDRDYRSDDPAMRALNPRVYQIFVDLR